VEVPGRSLNAAPHARPTLDRTERTKVEGRGTSGEGLRSLDILETCGKESANKVEDDAYMNGLLRRTCSNVR
jgi:hypothetical protein